MGFKLENSDNGDFHNKESKKWLEILNQEINFFGKSFNSKKKEFVYVELSILLKAGVNLKESLQLISDSFKKTSDKEIIDSILLSLIEGNSFSKSIQKLNLFSEYETQSIRIGEETGNLSIIADELSKFFKRKNEQKRVILSALTYPTIVLTTAFIVVFFMLTYVVPMFEDIFKQNKIELPFLTRFIIQFSSLIKQYGLYFVVILVSSFYAFYKIFQNNDTVKREIHYFFSKIPFIGNFITKIYLSQFIQAVALLTSSKVPLVTVIEMTKQITIFIPLKDAILGIEKKILLGESLSQSMSNYKIFDSRIVSLVKVAEETNKSDYVFKQLNEQFSEELKTQSKNLTTILEPLMILFIGGIVAILLIALYLPMFQLSSIIN